MISIIVPMYNVEEYIDDCLGSLSNQLDKNFEVVLVNDGSTDRSLERASEWFDKLPSIKVIDQQNKGLSGARNSGLKVATYDYVMFLDSDDRLSIEAIATLVASINDSNPDCILFSATVFGDNELSSTLRLDNNCYNRLASSSSETISGSDYLHTTLNNERFIQSACMYTFRKKTAKDLQFIEGILHEDNHFTPMLLLSCNSVVVINDPLYCRRIRSNSIMTNPITDRNVEGYYRSAKTIFESFQPKSERERIIIEKLYLQGFLAASIAAIRLNDRNLCRSWLELIRSELYDNEIENKRLPFKLYLALYYPFIVRLLMKIKAKTNIVLRFIRV